LGKSGSVELVLKVNHSTSKNTFVCRVAGVTVDSLFEDGGGALSFPRLVDDENALEKEKEKIL